MNSMHMYWTNAFNLAFSLGILTEIHKFREDLLYSRVLTLKAVEPRVDIFFGNRHSMVLGVPSLVRECSKFS